MQSFEFTTATGALNRFASGSIFSIVISICLSNQATGLASALIRVGVENSKFGWDEETSLGAFAPQAYAMIQSDSDSCRIN
jgi:hypothetical protein